MSPLEEPKFLHFQDIVDQARKSIQLYCPEWTDYNLSDPGITLIELFAYMTSQLNYRLNRVPSRNYLKFLDMVGVKPRPPHPASTVLTFKLAAPLPLLRADGALDESVPPIHIPANTTQVATRRSTSEDEEIIFITTQERWIRPPLFTNLHRDFAGIDKDQQFEHNYLTTAPTERGPLYVVQTDGFQPFQPTPQEDDTFYLGFASEFNIEGYLLQFKVECAPGEGRKVSVFDPPLIWEAGVEQDKAWQRVEVVEDTTGGFNRNGAISLRLPVNMDPLRVRSENRRLYWLRCRLKKERMGQIMYERSPRITLLQAFVVGAAALALHSAPIIEPEGMGRSDGEPGQQFNLQRAPVLPLDPKRGEYVEVEEELPDGFRQFVPWELRDDFSQSTKYDRHVTLDPEIGRICFGPAVRQPNGQVRQYGMIPTLGSRIRVSQYRTGGGVKGNVPRNSLVVLKQAISYVVEVSNHQDVTDGRDGETVEATILRAQEELKGRTRAVTAADYEALCHRSRLVARVKCLEPGPSPSPIAPGWVKLLVVPSTGSTQTESESDRNSEDLTEFEAVCRLSHLQLTENRQKELRKFLEPYRMLGITLHLAEPTYYGLKVEATVQAHPWADTQRVRQAIIRRLTEFLDPVGRLPSLPERAVQVSGDLSGGWSFGRSLYKSDIYAKIQAVDGVDALTDDIQIQWCQIDMNRLVLELQAEQRPRFEWRAMEKGVLPISMDGLVCLLNVDDIKVKRLDDHD